MTLGFYWKEIICTNYKSFCIENFKSTLTIRPIMIKRIPMYEFKDSSKIFNQVSKEILAHESSKLNDDKTKIFKNHKNFALFLINKWVIKVEWDLLF